MIFQMSNRLHDVTLPSYDHKRKQEEVHPNVRLHVVNNYEMHLTMLSYRMVLRVFTARKNHKFKQDLTKRSQQEEVSLHI